MPAPRQRLARSRRSIRASSRRRSISSEPTRTNSPRRQTLNTSNARRYVTPALALENITCTFISREDRSQRYTAVRDTTLRVHAGEFVSVVGPTGCGKSTLLNVAAGVLEPSPGAGRVFGEPLSGVNSRAGYLFQTDALMPWRNALANITAGLEFRGVEPKEILERAQDWLRRVGLAGFGDRYPHQLSGGMKKRVALAQTLILDHGIRLMEEPFSALDIQTRQLMENL